MQETSDRRKHRGYVKSFMKGSGKVQQSNLDLNDNMSVRFKEMLDFIERNHGTQVCVFRRAPQLAGTPCFPPSPAPPPRPFPSGGGGGVGGRVL